MDEPLYDEFGNYIGPELSGSEDVSLLGYSCHFALKWNGLAWPGLATQAILPGLRLHLALALCSLFSGILWFESAPRSSIVALGVFWPVSCFVQAGLSASGQHFLRRSSDYLPSVVVSCIMLRATTSVVLPGC